MMKSDSEQAVNHVLRRLMPFLFLAYIANFLDRANVAYAALQMSQDLHFSDRIFGLGAGMFFVGYVVLQIPSALVVERWSARKCISVIMVVWGLTTVLLAFVRTPNQFYAARFLLGIAEAGFFPGVIVYLTHWISYRDRARATAHFMAAVPISFVITSPLAAWLLRVHWFGLQGWHWIFIAEGFPAIILGVVAMFYLTDRPADAHWLTPQERGWVVTLLERDAQSKKATQGYPWWQALLQRDVILLSLVAFFSFTGVYGIIFWLPTILKRLSGLSDSKTALLSALPYIAGFFAMQLSAWHSDRSNERRWHAAVPLFVCGTSLLLARAFGANPWFAVMAFTFALFGYFGFLASFWAMPAALLSDSAAATSIGTVNLVGSIGGFVGPFVVGYLRARFGSFAVSLGVLAAVMLAAGFLATLLRAPGGSGLTESGVDAIQQPVS
jgi:ACS family tartrate transporter-like MFS transporter